MPDSVLQDLRSISDDELFTRLILLRQRMPKDNTAADWLYRSETWQMANTAIHAEIHRRKIIPSAVTVDGQLRRFALLFGCIAFAVPLIGALGVLASR